MLYDKKTPVGSCWTVKCYVSITCLMAAKPIGAVYSKLFVCHHHARCIDLLNSWHC